ncbi:bis(5'-nucleosyl)-tetraphosphatase (symmetrical) YqeK [Youxingia wuxianensis]|uniref:bis(5'-nucleosyl)-tetraphosphatase (symmetrical) n=1 Tax=Youxingia wuxianensis TaxID=2763678 RepID=A0A926ENA5_9FIRM|nr:bis(5'-nucleosyl)-tetraphosphatase (symmetrical) YqeK [Youxingia wuxianensis]MBC8584372.1 bis(5'-nucleosyl)-tetraphosphatase (symmetrical) YqeK [Youxingia wuxianensis]
MHDLDKLDKLVKETLSEYRYYHTVCVVKQARKLAKQYGCDVQKAAVAAYLHDICKEMNPAEQLHWIAKFGIILDDILRDQAKTWHGMAACGYIKETLDIQDMDILNAVRYHTIARGKMSLLEEIIYMADLTSDDRDYEDVEHFRLLAKTNLKQAMKEALAYSVESLVSMEQGICQDTIDGYNYYIKLK